MEIQSLKCNHCSADLKINPKIKFFNCNFCGSSLTIKNSGGVVFTEVIGEIKENTDSILDNSNSMLLEQQLERVDREWLLEREQYLIPGKNGSSSLPLKANAIALSVVPILMITGIIIFALQSNFIDSGLILIPIVFTVIFSIISIAWAAKINSRLNAYTSAKEKYEKKRNEIASKIEMSKIS